MLTVPPSTKLWFAPAVDLRLGFDGLANLVRSQLNADPLSGHLFVFTNRSADRVKVLYWGGHGLCLWCSRLEAGRYHFPGGDGRRRRADRHPVRHDPRRHRPLARPTLQAVCPPAGRESATRRLIRC